MHSIGKQDRSQLNTRLFHPGRDWVVGLFCAFVLCLGAAGYAGYEFLMFSKNIDEPVSLESSVVLYRQDKAQDVFVVYRDKNMQFDRLRSDKSNVPTEEITVDPGTAVNSDTEEVPDDASLTPE